jgi:hypothetical protein
MTGDSTLRNTYQHCGFADDAWSEPLRRPAYPAQMSALIYRVGSWCPTWFVIPLS